MPKSLCLMILVAACSSPSNDTGNACTPGKQEACACPGGAAGVQVCKTDGSGLEACQCGPDDGDTSQSDGDATPGPSSDVHAEVPDVESPGDTAAGPEVLFTEDTKLPADIVPSESCQPCANGPVKGLVCAPSEQHFITGASVTIDAIGCDGEPVHLVTKSKPDGGYYFPEVPCGTHHVNVKSGSFEISYVIQVEPVTGTDITGAAKKQCFKAQGVPIAVFWGQWDEQGGILESLGFDYEFFYFKDDFFNDVPPDEIEAVQVLRDPIKLAAYKILFFNCASAPLEWVHGFPEIKQNLADFVYNGGSIYASDLSWAYIEAAFPNAIDFYGADDLPSSPGATAGPQHADGHQTVPATIVDPDLIDYVGASVFSAEYGPGPLILVDSPGTGAVEHVRGLVQTDEDTGILQPPKKVVGPLVVTFKPSANSGTLVYTTFHNDEQADELMTKILDYLVFKL